MLVKCARSQWLTPLILTTWEDEIRRIEFPGQLAEIVSKTPSPK
jgi:hypothetical protein